MPAADVTFPLTPRRRLIGLSFGAMHSARRGAGSDVAGSRLYRPGDDVDTIDWAASARLSSARGTDEFVVRERYADEAPRVAIVVDRRPSMALHDASLPWLHKPAAIREAARMISDSTVASRGFVGYLDYGDGADAPLWRAPRSQHSLRQPADERPYDAPEDNLERAFRHLADQRRALPAGSFVFILSDFLVSPPADRWLDAVEHQWDLVPVVIQDPVWEASFPDVGGVVVPFADPCSGRVRLIRLGKREAAQRRDEHERRRERLLASFAELDVEPVLVSSHEQSDVLGGFLEWADQRVYRRGRGR
jgi:uncharacterized protein (DUF58 family)